MTIKHKNKTLATFLASTLGSIGMHRFYLNGMQDRWGWAHFVSLPVTGALILLLGNQVTLLALSPLVVSGLAGFVEALVIGLTPDDKWDAAYNPGSNRKSGSTWPLAIILVLTAGVGAVTLIAAIARTFDLIFTGGAYG